MEPVKPIGPVKPAGPVGPQSGGMGCDGSVPMGDMQTLAVLSESTTISTRSDVFISGITVTWFEERIFPPFEGRMKNARDCVPASLTTIRKYPFLSVQENPNSRCQAPSAL
jgi:hypothetical protein